MAFQHWQEVILSVIERDGTIPKKSNEIDRRISILPAY